MTQKHSDYQAKKENLQLLPTLVTHTPTTRLLKERATNKVELFSCLDFKNRKQPHSPSQKSSHGGALKRLVPIRRTPIRPIRKLTPSVDLSEGSNKYAPQDAADTNRRKLSPSQQKHTLWSACRRISFTGPESTKAFSTSAQRCVPTSSSPRASSE